MKTTRSGLWDDVNIIFLLAECFFSVEVLV
jgi:hypothetical protein